MVNKMKVKKQKIKIFSGYVYNPFYTGEKFDLIETIDKFIKDKEIDDVDIKIIQKESGRFHSIAKIKYIQEEEMTETEYQINKRFYPSIYDE